MTDAAGGYLCSCCFAFWCNHKDLAPLDASNDPVLPSHDTAVLSAWRKLPEPAQRILFACLRTFDQKGADYREGSADPFANFKRVSEAVGVTPEQAWFTYAYKHWSAVAGWCRRGQLESEPVWSRLMDVIVYCILLYGHVEARGEKGAPPIL